MDDGSTDNTASIVEQYVGRYEHIKFIKFSHNRGVNAARNAAISAASGDWCVILDSDDYFIDDALQIINETLVYQAGYKHYMFAANDMQSYYTKNVVIRGRAKCVLTYPDFLNGYIGGDFIHVCNTEILRRNPFDEQLRIYEGLFFLKFYREARKMLFTDKIVTIRERQRRDSVSRDFIRTNKQIIKRSIRFGELTLADFGEEMERLGMARRLAAIRINLLDNLLLLEKYAEASDIIKLVSPGTSKKLFLLKFVLHFHLGGLYRIALKSYLVTKYKVFSHKIK